MKRHLREVSSERVAMRHDSFAFCDEVDERGGESLRDFRADRFRAIAADEPCLHVGVVDELDFEKASGDALPVRIDAQMVE